MSHYKLILYLFVLALFLGTSCTQTATNTVTNTNTANENANVEVAINSNETVGNENTNIPDESGEVDTSDWLTYTNEEYGFSFKYPSQYENTTINIERCSENNECDNNVGESFFWYYSDDEGKQHYSVAGSSTEGFAAGRDFRFTDTVRYEQNNILYEVIMPNGDKFPVTVLNSIQTDLGKSVIYSVEDLPSYPMMSDENKNDQVAILNFDEPINNYEAISFYIPSSFTDLDVQKILESVAK